METLQSLLYTLLAILAVYVLLRWPLSKFADLSSKSRALAALGVLYYGVLLIGSIAFSVLCIWIAYAHCLELAKNERLAALILFLLLIGIHESWECWERRQVASRDEKLNP